MVLCYLIHKLPIWKSNEISNGARNLRVLCVAAIIYIIIQVICYAFKTQSVLHESCYRWFPLVLVADAFLCGIEYKMYYGRSMLHELDSREHDTYDATTHTYIPKPKEVNKSNTEHEISDEQDEPAPGT